MIYMYWATNPYKQKSVSYEQKILACLIRTVLLKCTVFLCIEPAEHFESSAWHTECLTVSVECVDIVLSPVCCEDLVII